MACLGNNSFNIWMIRVFISFGHPLHLDDKVYTKNLIYLLSGTKESHWRIFLCVSNKKLFSFFTVPHSLQDFSSPTWDWNQVTAVKVQNPNNKDTREFPNKKILEKYPSRMVKGGDLLWIILDLFTIKLYVFQRTNKHWKIW